MRATLGALVLLVTCPGHGSASARANGMTTPFTIHGRYGPARTSLARYEAVQARLDEAPDAIALFGTLQPDDQLAVVYFAAPELIDWVDAPLGRCTPEEVEEGCYENAVSDPEPPAVSVEPAPATACGSAIHRTEAKSFRIFGHDYAFYRFYQRVDFCYTGSQVQSASAVAGYENVTAPWSCTTSQTPPPGMPFTTVQPAAPALRVLVDSTGSCSFSVHLQAGPFGGDVDWTKAPHISRQVDGTGSSVVVSSNGG